MTDDRVLVWRDKMSTLWHDSSTLWITHPYLGFTSWDHHTAFCVAKDWIQDTGDAILVHRRKGFGQKPLQSYQEFWGILQGLVVQQDAIKELSYAVNGIRLQNNYTTGKAWSKLRELRNLAVGHPNNKTLGAFKGRAVVCRQSMTYENILLVFYGPADDERMQTINLGKLIDEYDDEAGALMSSLYSSLQEIVSNLKSQIPVTSLGLQQ